MTGRADRRTLITGAAAALAAAALGGVWPTPSSAGERRPAAHVVEIDGFRFRPAVLRARAGDTITWINRDIAPHTATATDGTWDTGEIGGGQSRTLTVSGGTGGAYFCRFHPMMKARVVSVPD